MTKALEDLNITDTVLVKRNLEHPAHRIPVNDPHGMTTYVLDQSVEETIGGSRVVERYDAPASGQTDRNYRPGRSLVRLSNGFWYDLQDGYQDGSEATYIEPI